MANLDELEAEFHAPTEKVDQELEVLKNKFLTRWGFHYCKTDMQKALDELLDFVRMHR